MPFDTGLSKMFLDISPQARETKAKISKGDYIKLKSFCIVIKTINKTKQPGCLLNWKRYLQLIYQIGVNTQNVPKTHKSKHQESKKPIGERPEQTIFQRGCTDGQQARGKCSTTLIIRDLQIKTTVMYITSHVSEWLSSTRDDISW